MTNIHFIHFIYLFHTDFLFTYSSFMIYLFAINSDINTNYGEKMESFDIFGLLYIADEKKGIFFISKYDSCIILLYSILSF